MAFHSTILITGIEFKFTACLRLFERESRLVPHLFLSAKNGFCLKLRRLEMVNQVLQSLRSCEGHEMRQLVMLQFILPSPNPFMSKRNKYFALKVM
ncbi:lipoyl synthase [Mobiluncus mulieris]|nr:lipoyl synthase [Mobiluncus mulieris]